MHAPLPLQRLLALLLLLGPALALPQPNFVFILSDDLGWGEVSFNPGRTNTNISTPHLDALARAGMVFTRAYTGAPVCAPSRGTLMTGKHTGHATIRGNRGTPSGGDYPLLPNPQDKTFLLALRDAGYHISCVGKWGMGDAGSPGDAIAKGCSDYYGVLNQNDAHNMYPSDPAFTWRYPAANGSAAWEGLPFPANANASRAACMAPGSGCVWAHDLWTGAALQALQAHAQRPPGTPLFLYLAYTDPHAGGWGGTAEQGNPVPSDGRFAAEPWPANERDHASAIENFQDRDVGVLLAALEAAGMADSTAVVFASDNGASNEGGHDYEFFDSSGPLRGFKRCLTEGGIRTPLVVRWPGVVAAGVVSTYPVYFPDFGDTILDLAGLPPAQWLRQDGVSFKGALTSPTGQPAPAPGGEKPLYFEFCTAVHPPLEPRTGKGWGRAIINGTWKALSFFEDQPLRLYDLEADVYEVRDQASSFPDIVQALGAWGDSQHVDQPDFPVTNCVGS